MRERYKTRLLAPEALAARCQAARAFAEQHGYNALTGSDASWLLLYVEYLESQVAKLEQQIAAPPRGQGAHPPSSP